VFAAFCLLGGSPEVRLLATSHAIRVAALAAGFVLARRLRGPAKVAAEMSRAVAHVIVSTAATSVLTGHVGDLLF
jgi:hypothetical protein